MAVCAICGKQYGMFGGGDEPYTGKRFLICNECGAVLKKIDKAKDNPKECKELAYRLISSCGNSEVVVAISDYLEKICGESEDAKEFKKDAEIHKQRLEEVENKFLEYSRNFKSTTGYNFDGYRISEYKGIVSGEVVLGTGFISEYSASLSDIFGTQSKAFADKMEIAKREALSNLTKNALVKGGNALIGVDFDYITFSNNILGVSANGTTVVIEKIAVE